MTTKVVIIISHTLNNHKYQPPSHSVRQFSSKFTSTLVIIPPIKGSTWDWIIPNTSPQLTSQQNTDRTRVTLS